MGRWGPTGRTTIQRPTRKEVQKKVVELKKRGFVSVMEPEIKEEVTLWGTIFYVAVMQKEDLSK